MKNRDLLKYMVVGILHLMTAKALGAPFRPGRNALRTYAVFTKEQIEQIKKDDIPKIKLRMYIIAYRMGRFIRKILFIKNEERAKRVLFGLYRCIDIDLEGDCPGIVTVRRCYFSRFYTPEICAVMSAMDKGIFAGILGGGKLVFKSRITEGCKHCKAKFR